MWRLILYCGTLVVRVDKKATNHEFYWVIEREKTPYFYDALSRSLLFSCLFINAKANAISQIARMKNKDIELNFYICLINIISLLV